MDTWIWLTIIGVVAVALFAALWWSSGRARPRSRGPQTSMTESQYERINQAQSGDIGNTSGWTSL
jgi:hypothetical protein